MLTIIVNLSIKLFNMMATFNNWHCCTVYDQYSWDLLHVVHTLYLIVKIVPVYSELSMHILLQEAMEKANNAIRFQSSSQHSDWN